MPRGREHECIKKSWIGFFFQDGALLTSLKVIHQARSRHTYEWHITFLHFFFVGQHFTAVCF